MSRAKTFISWTCCLGGWNIPELERAVREQCEAFAADVVLIEDKTSGIQLIQELIHEGLHAVTRCRPQSDKIIRSRRCRRQRLLRQAKLRVADAR